MSKSLATTDSIKGLIAKKDTTLGDVLSHVAPAVVSPPPVEPPLPKPPALAKKAADATATLPMALAGLVVPNTRRKLTTDELKAYTEAWEQTKIVKAAVGKVEDSLKPVFFNHFDAVARERGLEKANTPRTKDGWLVIPDESSASVPGLDKKLTREVSKGTANFGMNDLVAMEAAGEITHERFLKLTNQVRVLDESAVMDEIAEDPELRALIAKRIKVTGANASLNLRAND